MTSNTQDNSDRARAPFGTNTGLRDNDPSLSSQDPSSGLGIRDTGIDAGKAGYGSTQQQYDKGTTTGQYDSSRFAEEGMEGGAGQNQYGRGQGGTGTGVGHHKGHHEGHLHGHGPGEAEKANCRTQLGQDTGVSTGGTKTTTDTSAYGTGTQTGDTTGFGAGTDTTEHHGGATTGHHRHQSGNDTKASMKDKIIGGVEKVAGKMTSNTEMYQRGEERAANIKAGETAMKKN